MTEGKETKTVEFVGMIWLPLHLLKLPLLATKKKEKNKNNLGFLRN